MCDFELSLLYNLYKKYKPNRLNNTNEENVNSENTLYPLITSKVPVIGPV